MKHIKLFENHKIIDIENDVRDILIEFFDDNIDHPFEIKVETIERGPNNLRIIIGSDSRSKVDFVKHIDSILRAIEYVEQNGYEFSSYMYDNGKKYIYPILGLKVTNSFTQTREKLINSMKEVENACRTKIFFR